MIILPWKNNSGEKLGHVVVRGLCLIDSMRNDRIDSRDVGYVVLFLSKGEPDESRAICEVWIEGYTYRNLS